MFFGLDLWPQHFCLPLVLILCVVIVHLVGSKHERGKMTVGDIARETACHTKINYDSRADYAKNDEPLPPITITVHARSPVSAKQALSDVRHQLQALLLDFVGNDGSRGHLLYEIALSCRGDHHPEDSTCNAVGESDPFGEDPRCRFITVI